MPAGRLASASTETTLHLEGRITSLEELRDTVVARVGGEVVRVRDVGEVVDHEVERRTLVRVDGQEAVSIEVVKQSAATRSRCPRT